MERIAVADGKTRSLVARLADLGLRAQPTVLVVKALDDLLRRAARNVPWLTVETAAHVSVYQLLRARQSVFEREALLELQEALAP